MQPEEAEGVGAAEREVRGVGGEAGEPEAEPAAFADAVSKECDAYERQQRSIQLSNLHTRWGNKSSQPPSMFSMTDRSRDVEIRSRRRKKQRSQENLTEYVGLRRKEDPPKKHPQARRREYDLRAINFRMDQNMKSLDHIITTNNRHQMRSDHQITALKQ